MQEDNYHESVMIREAIDSLHIEKDKKYIDATLGTGGHSLEICKLGGAVFGIDADPENVEVARVRLSACNAPHTFVNGNFKDIDRLANENGFTKVSGVIFDLGVTNIHLTSLSRGFSFVNPEAALDMRLDTKIQGITGADLLNLLREDQLRNLFEVTLDPGAAKWLARRVLKSRSLFPIKTVGDFLEICEGIRGKPGLNSATLPFLALRIAVNSELDNLKEALPKAYELLEKGGRLVVISFHSGEDVIVKQFMGSQSKPLFVSDEEKFKNPRARSARMRVLTK